MKSPEQNTTQNEIISAGEENEKMDRRTFLGKSIRTLIALKLGELGFFTPEVEASGKKHEKKENPEGAKKWNEIQETVEQFLAEKTELTPEEINTELHKCKFLEGENIPQQSLDIKKPWKPFDKRDVLTEELNEAKVDGRIHQNNNTLNVIRTNFNEIGVMNYGAFYLSQDRTLFLNQDDTMDKKKELEEEIYDGAISKEFSEQSDFLFQAKISALERDEKYKKLQKWSKKMHEQPKKPDAIRALIEKHADGILSDLNRYQMHRMHTKEITKRFIPHEVFHDFFEKRFGKEGYSGPDINEVLATAIKGKFEKFGKESPDYESNISEYINDINITDEESLTNFCKDITSKFDIVNRPKDIPDEKWRQLTDNERHDFTKQKTLFNFVNEYMARIYNGALGNTPKELEKNATIISGKYNQKDPGYNYYHAMHTPNQEELKLLQRMQWNGKNIL